MTHAPTTETYTELQRAYDHFNHTLFENALSPCLLTLQRERTSFGYFHNGCFEHRDSGERSDEIALNPRYFGGREIRETLSTLAHEMVHQWQAQWGQPGRRGYHNKQWAARMEAIGLMPSDTGQPNGRKVGERMTHYIIEHGAFDRTCRDLLTQAFTLSWKEHVNVMQSSLSLGATLIGGAVEKRTDRSLRVKYRCPGCQIQVWGKPALRILCGNAACDAAVMVCTNEEVPDDH